MVCSSSTSGFQARKVVKYPGDGSPGRTRSRWPLVACSGVSPHSAHLHLDPHGRPLGAEKAVVLRPAGVEVVDLEWFFRAERDWNGWLIPCGAFHGGEIGVTIAAIGWRPSWLEPCDALEGEKGVVTRIYRGPLDGTTPAL